MNPNKRVIASIRPLFLGGLFYLFILLANNAQWISKDAIKTWTAIIAGSLFLYLIAYAAIYQRKNLMLAGVGFSLVGLLFSICIPLYLITNKILFTENTKKTTQLNQEANKFSIIDNDGECQKIKYGTFVYGIDTIIRYSEDCKDYELLKIYGIEAELHAIKWLDSCSYVTLDNRSSVLEYIKLGNFDGENHQMYIKPVTTNSLKNEEIKTMTHVKN